MAARHKSVETKYMEERDAVLRGLRGLDRRSFLKVLAAIGGCRDGEGLMPPHSFQLVKLADAATDKTSGRPGWQGKRPFTFAYISDTHLYERTLNQRFVRAAVKAVEDVNALDPQPDFVLFGGDLAQLGRREELELGKQILDELKAPVKMMVGEHDWFHDLGDTWQELFGPPNYSFDWKGVHVITLMSVHEKDFWTALKMTPAERMQTVAGLDNGTQSRFEVGDEEREWLCNDLAKVPHTTPLLIFSHSPLYKYYHNWNFWTEDAEQVQEILQAVQARDRHPRPYASDALQPDPQHQFLRDALDGVAVALRAAAAAAADGADESRRSVRSVRRAGRRPVQCPPRRTGGQHLQSLGSQSGDGEGRLPDFARQVARPPAPQFRELLRHASFEASMIRRRSIHWQLPRDVRPSSRLSRRAADSRTAGAVDTTGYSSVAASKNGGVVVMLCDGKTSMEVKGLKPGESMSHEQALAVTRDLMAKWQRQHPDKNGRWRRPTNRHSRCLLHRKHQVQMSRSRARRRERSLAQKESSRATPMPVSPIATSKSGRAKLKPSSHQGKKIFHDAKELGGTIGVSCDMCHPDASNTHPETYPKYQVQLQKSGAAARHDRLVYRESGQGQGARPQRSKTARARSVHPRPAQRLPTRLRQALS